MCTITESPDRVRKNQLDALVLSIFRQPLHVSGVSGPSSVVCCTGWVGTTQPVQQTVI